LVIEPVDDFNITSIGKAPMGEICLPGLIRLNRLKALDVSLRPLFRFWYDKTFCCEGTPEG